MRGYYLQNDEPACTAGAPASIPTPAPAVATLIAEQNVKYEESLATDQHINELENQITTLTGQAHALTAQYGPDIARVPFEISQQMSHFYQDIIATHRKLINIIQATQTYDKLFAQAQNMRLIKQNDALSDELTQLDRIERALDTYVPTTDEIRATRENYFLKKFNDGGKGKMPI